jgi:hypothetical protein
VRHARRRARRGARPHASSPPCHRRALCRTSCSCMRMAPCSRSAARRRTLGTRASFDDARGAETAAAWHPASARMLSRDSAI